VAALAYDTAVIKKPTLDAKMAAHNPITGCKVFVTSAKLINAH
jgi:hypothetical protein